LAPSRVWHTANPDVDAEPGDVRAPRLLIDVVAEEVAADAEVPADRLADAVAVQRSRDGIGDGVRDRAVVLMSGVERRDEVVAALEDRPGEQLDPLGHDRSQVRVHHDEGLDLERGGHLEEGPQGRALAPDPVDLRVGQADPCQAVLGVDQEDLLHVAGRLGVHDDPLGSVGRARVGVDEDGPQIGEVLDESGL
jgi:hypothetical protein